MPPLLLAAREGELNRMRALLDEAGSGDVDRTDEGESALTLAAENGHVCAVRLLIERGAALHLPNKQGWQPVHCAAQCESPSTLALLLARGADVQSRTAIGVTPLHVAAFNGRLGACQALVAAGADVEAMDSDGRTPLDNARHWLLECACKSESADREWGGVVALLEKVGSMPNAHDRSEFACRLWQLRVSGELQRAAEEEETDALSALLLAHADDVNAADHDGSTALHAAATLGRCEAIVLLLDAGASLGAVTNLNESALHCAAREGHTDAARVLLLRGADATAATRSGRTPLESARGRGCEEVVRLIESHLSGAGQDLASEDERRAAARSFLPIRS